MGDSNKDLLIIDGPSEIQLTTSLKRKGRKTWIPLSFTFEAISSSDTCTFKLHVNYIARNGSTNGTQNYIVNGELEENFDHVTMLKAMGHSTVYKYIEYITFRYNPATKKGILDRIKAVTEPPTGD